MELEDPMDSTQSRIYRRILAGVAGSAVIGGGALVAVNWFLEQRMTARADAHAHEIISMLDLMGTLDFHKRLDRVRTFINDNSDHEIDEAFRANQGNTAAFAAGLIAHAKGVSSEPIHMECSTRTNLMGLVLQALGYQTRVVAIFNSKE
jgi:hypothetical protein